MTYHSGDLDQLFRALSDPTRRKIVTDLANQSGTVTELSRAHDMALPTFMAHLSKLEEAGIVSTQKQGRTRLCTLQPRAIVPVWSWLAEQRLAWEARTDRLEDYLASLSKEK